MNQHRHYIDLRDVYNAQLRARRIKRRLAVVGVILAAVLLALSFGTLLASAGSAIVGAIAINILICGFFGARHLITKH